ncbi:putative F-box/LRR-repeat/kelch-repeat protein At1g11620 [Cicer arietinum]|uniref:F-box protein At5g07610-like n=1 Tax=Cicer arietinum TaxID=3827 RepID=A0A1S3EB91_CICAR|nr:F-box protein At5g07610-like [Cicer arietinum]
MHMAHDISSSKFSSKCDINFLSDDLLAEIFTRLPFRSTVGCKCASKRWLDLISSPYFITQFVSHQHFLYKSILIFVTPHELMLAFREQSQSYCFSRNNSSLIEDILDKQKSQSLEIPVSFSPDMLLNGSICGCSNGIFLCCDNRYTYGSGYYVYNPLTKQSIPIPPSNSTSNENLFAVGFICNPYYDVHEGKKNVLKNVVAAPYSDERNFRVVIIKSFIIKMFHIEVDVFSSETGSWEHIIMNLPNGFAFAPHWLLSLSYDGSLYFMGRTSIFVFDPYTQQKDTLDYPQEADSMNIMSFGFLGISCGSLRIADIGQNDLRVWELIEKNHWDLLHRIDISTKLPQKFCANYYKRVAGFHPYDGDIVYLHSYTDGVFVCNLRTNKFEAILGYEKTDISPFQLEIKDLLLPSKSSSSIE